MLMTLAAMLAALQVADLPTVPLQFSLPQVSGVEVDVSCANTPALAASATCIKTSSSRVSSVFGEYSEVFASDGWRRFTSVQPSHVYFEKPSDEGQCAFFTVYALLDQRASGVRDSEADAMLVFRQFEDRPCRQP